MIRQFIKLYYLVTYGYHIMYKLNLDDYNLYYKATHFKTLSFPVHNITHYGKFNLFLMI